MQLGTVTGKSFGTARSRFRRQNQPAQGQASQTLRSQTMPSPEEVGNKSSAGSASGSRGRSAARFVVRVRIVLPRRDEQCVRIYGFSDSIGERRFRSGNVRIPQAKVNNGIAYEAKGFGGASLLPLPGCAQIRHIGIRGLTIGHRQQFHWYPARSLHDEQAPSPQRLVIRMG
jgi:hypothetical protein